MLRRPIWIFTVLVGCLVGGAVYFIQTERFANILKNTAVKYLPKDLGIEADFKGLRIKFIPPGVEFQNPTIKVHEKNLLGLPALVMKKSENVSVTFAPFQMISGQVRVREIVVNQGLVEIESDAIDRMNVQAKAKRQHAKRLSIKWEDLLGLRVDAVSLRETQIHFYGLETPVDLNFSVETLDLRKIIERRLPGYDLTVMLRSVQGVFPDQQGFQKIQGPIDSSELHAKINREGVKIDGLAIAAHGFKLEAKGDIKGDLLEIISDTSRASAGVGIDVNWGIAGDLARADILLKKMTSLPPLEGRVEIKGKLRANSAQFLESMRAEAKLNCYQGRFQKWEFDHLESNIKWNPFDGLGELVIENAVVSSTEKPRIGGERGATGGRVELGEMRIPRLLKDRPKHLNGSLRLEHAHLHWLAAPALKNVFPLDFRTDGKIDFAMELPHDGAPFWMQTKLDLAIPEFQLDNQKLGMSRPLSRVLHASNLRLRGGVDVGAKGIFPNALTLTIGKNSQANVTGKIDFTTGYDLHTEGPMDLADVGMLAENPIIGHGAIKVHVHGLPARTIVDFDTHLEDAEYLNLKLGKIDGLITYDDDPTIVLFKQVKLRQGESQMTGNGELSAAGQDSINLGIQIEQGNVSDLIRVFSHFVKDLWWFPESLRGQTTGTIRVQGGLSMDRLEIKGDLKGNQWELMRERFESVTLHGGFDRGKYEITSASAVKHTGSLNGKISYSKDAKIDWNLGFVDFSLHDFDMISRLDVPMRGKIKLASSGSGKFGAIESLTQATLTDTSVRGQQLAESDLLIRSANGIAEIQGIAMGGQGALDVAYSFTPGVPSHIRLDLKNFDFSPMLLLLNPKLIQDQELAGWISGSANLSFKSGEFERANGRMDLSRYSLIKQGTSFELARPVKVVSRDGTFELKDLSIRGKQGEIKMDLSSANTVLDGNIEGSIDVSLLEFVTSAVSNLKGTATVRASLGGTLKAPKFQGRASLNSISLKLPSVESPFENINGSLSLKQNILSVDNLESELAGGRATATGTIEIFSDKYPKVNLQGNLIGNKLKIYPFQYVKVRGRLTAHGESQPYLVDGKISVETALTKEKVMSQGGGKTLRTVQYSPPTSTRQSYDAPLFNLNIDVNADGKIFVQNDLFDAELKGQVTLVNTIETPRLVGSSELVQGKLTFKDRVFQIQSANIKFDNPTTLNPLFNMHAQTDVGATKVSMYAAGRMDRYKIELASNPVLAESEILSLLAVGVTPDDMRKLRNTDRASLEKGEAASLLLHSLDFNRDVQDKTGFQIDLDEAVNNQAVTSAFRSRVENESAAAPKIVIRRKIGKKMELSLGSTLGVGTNNQREVNAEYRFTPAFSVLGVWDTLDALDQQDSHTSYGLDIKVQKRFK